MPRYCVSCGQVNTNWGNLCSPCKEEEAKAERAEKLKQIEERGLGLVFYRVKGDPIVLYDTKDGGWHCCEHDLPSNGKPWANSTICDNCKWVMKALAEGEKRKREEEDRRLERELKKLELLKSFEEEE